MGLPRQTGRYRADAVCPPVVAASVMGTNHGSALADRGSGRDENRGLSPDLKQMAETEETVNILAVDDSAEKLLAISALLADLGQNVVTATSGREALRHLLRQEFAVVLLDVNMPGMDGFETAALIRQRKSSEHTPIIFITAYGDELHAARGYSLGAVDFIVSPVDPAVLRTKVSVFLELYRKTEEAHRSTEQLRRHASQLRRLANAAAAIHAA